MQSSIMPARAARHSGLHSEERVVRIDRAHRANFLHVIGAAAHRHSGLYETAQRLEMAEPVFTEMFRKRACVEVKPGGLDVHHDAEAGGHGDGFAALKVCVRETRACFAQAHATSF